MDWIISLFYFKAIIRFHVGAIQVQSIRSIDMESTEHLQQLHWTSHALHSLSSNSNVADRDYAFILHLHTRGKQMKQERTSLYPSKSSYCPNQRIYINIPSFQYTTPNLWVNMLYKSPKYFFIKWNVLTLIHFFSITHL